jgi:autotransporter-associated beta strand protein
VGTVDLMAGGNYVMNSYGNSTTSGGFMNFTNSSVTASTLTFTNANNYISVGTAGGRTLTNASANLTIAFNGAVDIGSSTSNNVTFAGPGNFTLNGSLTNSGTAVRDLTKTGDGTLTLNAASGYNGVTTLNLGTIALGANGTLGTNSVIIGATSTLAVGTSSSTIKDLTVNNGTITGSGTLNSANSFIFNNTATSTVSANLAGAASFTQTGSGKVILSGSNSFSGGLNLNSATNANGLDVTRAEALGTGTITAGSTNSRLGLNTITSLTITNAVNTGSSNTATMAFTPGASGNSMKVTGLISGSGIAKVSGGGDLYLNNIGNTYAGGTEVGTGRIFVGSDGALGAINGAVNFGTMTNSLLAVTSDVSFNASRNFTMSAAGYTANIDTGANNVTINGMIAPISGVTGGLLAKLGTGALTLGGNNTYSGGTIVSAGTLIGTTASLQGAITNNAAVIFNQSSSGSYANVMSGTGSLSKTNSGMVTLTRTNTYSGATTVSQGTLLVDSTGSIASSSLATVNGGLLNVNGTAGAVTVNRGGSLGGSGSVGALSLNSGGLLNPGNSPGTLTAATATILGGSTYNWQISALRGTAGSNWDLFNVNGLLNMTGVTSADKWNLVVTADTGFGGWTDTDSYSYVFAQASDVSGFDTTVGTDISSLFNITTSGFTSNSLPLPNASFNPNGDFKVIVGSATGANGGSITTLNLMAVPEPSTGSMLMLGLGGLVLTRLLRRKAS